MKLDGHVRNSYAGVLSKSGLCSPTRSGDMLVQSDASFSHAFTLKCRIELRVALINRRYLGNGSFDCAEIWRRDSRKVHGADLQIWRRSAIAFGSPNGSKSVVVNVQVKHKVESKSQSLFHQRSRKKGASLYCDVDRYRGVRDTHWLCVRVRLATDYRTPRLLKGHEAVTQQGNLWEQTYLIT